MATKEEDELVCNTCGGMAIMITEVDLYFASDKIDENRAPHYLATCANECFTPQRFFFPSKEAAKDFLVANHFGRKVG